MMKRLQILLLCMLSIGSVLAQTPTINSVYNKNGWVQVASPSGNGRMFFPRTYTFDILNGTDVVKKISLAWQTTPDTISSFMAHTHTGAINEGATWNAPAPTSHSGVGDFDLMGAVKRNTDGVLYSVPFFWGAGADTTSSLVYYTSIDNGTVWTYHNEGHLHFKTLTDSAKVGSFHFHRGIIQDADGTMYAPAYAQEQNANGTYTILRSMLMRSKDGGVNWRRVSDIQYTSNLSYTETTIARCRDGSILAVLRNDPNSLKCRRSTDNGATWSGLVFLPGLPTNIGVDPILEMLPNGVLALGYGDNITGSMPKRNCYVAFSQDGNGNNWTFNTETFAGGATPSLSAKNESTGYTSLASLRSNRFLQFSDRGDYRYYGGSQTPSPNPQSIWSKALEVVTNYKNRIDLKSKYATGDITVTSDLTYANPNQPQTREGAAFDANTDYWNGAFKQAMSGTMTIDLLKNTRLNGLAVCLLKGQPETATISYMADGGTSWSVMKSYAGSTHYTVDYTTLSTEVNARYVKIALSAPTNLVGLNEIVLYGSADTYEDYAYGGVPDGYTASDATTPAFWVTEGVVPLPSGYKSKRGLFMDDEDSANKELSKVGYAASATKTMEFMLRTQGYATSGCVQFRLMSGTTNVFRMAVFPTGIIKYYNGTWNNVGSGPVSVPLNTWKAIKVVANASTNTASVYVDGVLIGSNVTKETAAATSINGFLFASSGSSSVGDKAMFDDVELYTTGAFPASLQQDAPADETLAAPLKQTDAAKGAMAVVVSPNPSSNVATVTVKNIVKGPVDIELHNFYGKKLKSFSFLSEGDSFSTSIPVQEYGPGIYIITVKQNGKVVQTKLMK